MIELRNVVKIYPTAAGPKVVLAGVSAVFPPRVNYGILGRNGAGKSTLMRLLSGVEPPDSGRIIRKGRISPPLGFSGGVSPNLSGEENCRFVARIYGEDIDYITSFAREFADIGPYFNEPVKTYSSGMRSRLIFGLSMAIGFDVYLVDESTAVGDWSFKAKAQAAFDERRKTSSLFVVSHSFKTIESLCDRCAILKDGHLTFFDSVADAKAAYEGQA